MERKDFFLRLTAILEDGNPSPEGSHPLRPNEWDSLELIEVIALIDSAFGVAVSSSDLAECRTFGSLWELIDRARA
jgi:acyl carrier protein